MGSYQEAVEALERWSEDASDVVTGCAPPVFHDVCMIKDDVFAELTKYSSLDTATSELLQQIFRRMTVDCRRQLEDQLPGGKDGEPDETLVRRAKSCIGNNISGERVFGQLDFET